MSYSVAVVGATGAVGQQLFRVLERRNFPVKVLSPLASARSAGGRVTFRGEEHQVRELTKDSFSGVDLALFSAGGSVSRDFAPAAAEAGAWVVDNTSHFRMHDDVPLVVPEVNPHHLEQAPGRIVANPNCSTIQMVAALEPIRRAAGLKRVVVSTYQAVSGAGRLAMDELEAQVQARAAGEQGPPPVKFPHPILGECLPQIGAFLPGGDTVEEIKMIQETRKIFGIPGLAVTATTVRVPVLVGHSEAINVETERYIDADDARELLRGAPGLEVVDDPGEGRYPLARAAAGTDPVYVGRIRQDPSVERGLNLWVVADNLLKGAALNAVQIAELLFRL